MKLFLKVFLVALVLFLLSFFSVSALGMDELEYTVGSEGGEYILSRYSDGNMQEIKRSADISEIFTYLDGGAGSVVFEGITVNENISLNKGSYTFSGSLVFMADKQLEIFGADITLAEMTLKLSGNGSVRIKSGSLSLISGSIISELSSAVLLDYSAKAEFSMQGGSLESSSLRGALDLKIGSAQISGGTIKNAKESAIINDSSLIICGSPNISGESYSVITSNPIILSSNDKGLLSDISVKFLSAFSEGELTCVLYETDEESMRHVSLFDISDNEYKLTWFENYSGIPEKNFGAVYLPHTVRFFEDGVLKDTQNLLSNEQISVPEISAKEGFLTKGWSDSKVSGLLYDFKQNVNKSLDLYAVYALEAPRFSLSSLSFTYDGAEHELGLDYLTHPLLLGSIVSYNWYFNGSLASTSERVMLRSTSDSGEYSCKISMTYGTETVSVTTPSVSVEILKANVKIPYVAPKYYNGEFQRPDVFSTSVYTVSDISCDIVGVYPFTLTLTDAENYTFEGQTGASVTLDFEILKADNFWTDPPFAFDAYEGFELRVGATSRFGSPVFKFSSSPDGVYTELLPTDFGIYYVIAEVYSTDNYGALVSSPVRFNIIKEEASGISVETAADRLDYIAFEAFSPSGLFFNVAYNSSRTEVVSGELFNYSYQSADSFRFGDTAVIAEYRGVSIAVPVNVERAEYDLSHISFSERDTVYNGMEQTVPLVGTLPVGMDGIPLQCTVIGKGVNSGVYTAVLSFSTESVNYNVPKSITASLIIKPYSTPAVFSDTEFVYDGELKVPKAFYLDIYGRKIPLTVLGGRSLAGSYTAVASTDDSNYKIENASTEYIINKADYDFSAAYWTDSEFVYDGSEKQVEIFGLPSGVAVIGYTDSKGTDAGNYTASVILSYDSENYNPPPALVYSWRINKAEYPTDGFEFSDKLAVYDGSLHYPELSGSMPTGADGIRLSYKFSEGALHVLEGRKEIVITFFTESKNYSAPSPISAYAEITPMQISAVWGNTDFTYDGAPKLPSAESEYCKIEVLGSKINAGEYTATAVSHNSDYEIVNSRISFVINKAQNSWLTPPTVSDIFEGRSPSPDAHVLAGAVVYKYFSDAECLNEVYAPKNAGVYYLVAESDGDINHSPVKSQPIRFEIIKIVPVKLHISLIKEELFAHDGLNPEDFVAMLENNDGSFTELDSKTVSVAYEREDSLRAGDSFVTLSCAGFSVKLPISVKKASFDLSALSWGSTVFVYDGNVKSIYLSGVPKGINITSYKGEPAVNSGFYEVIPVFTFDSENYNEPTLPKGIIEIKKQTVAVPEIIPCVYNGKRQTPTVEASALYTFSYVSEVNAGEYAVVFSLLNSNNYTFENGESEIIKPFKIFAAEITVKITDVDKFLFEDAPAPTWYVTEGSIFDGDIIELIFKTEGRKIYASCISENYDVKIIPGTVNNTGKLSQNGLFKLFFILLIFVLLVLLILLLIFRRRDVVMYAARIRCKLSAPVKSEPSSGARAEDDKKDESAALKSPENSDEGMDEESSDERDGEENLEADIMAQVGEDEKIHGEMLAALSVDVERADSLISDSLAKDLVHKDDNTVYTDGSRKRIINVDTLSDNFEAGERVDVNKLKEMSLVPYDTAYIKVLARGMIDKPLKVYANDFSLSAVKMIALTGGSAVKVVTVNSKKSKN